MSRQPESVEGLSIDMSGFPGVTPSAGEEPSLGDIYKPRAGQPGFWWVVGIVRGECHHTAFYLTFNVRGELVGQGKAAMYYLRERDKIGHADMLPLQPEWF